MLARTPLLGLAFTAMLGGAAAGCSHQQTASTGPARSTMSLAQGDAVGRALLTPAAAPAQPAETATAQIDTSPAAD